MSRKQILSSYRKIRIKSSSFWSEFFPQRALYNCISGVCSEFFDWSCRSAPKKSFTACWSVFHRFCTVLPFLRFASLKLAYSLQKLYGNLEKQYTFKNIFISSKEQLYYYGY